MLRVLIAILCLGGPTLADELRYANSRFGTSASLPMDVAPLQAPENGDGYHFSRSGLEGTISIYGSHNIWGGGLAGYRKELSKSFETITYKAGKKDWFVLSGHEGESVFYVRVRGCTNGPMHHIHFQFPREEKSKWDAVIATYAKTLDGPCG
ncbi:MAG TPA: hypothetical protein DCS30_02945 [Rhizobiales bacterium]|nr:hypothetical protein [Hyphomicrobiales bacterium]